MTNQVMCLPELVAALERMSQVDLALTMFYLAGFMSDQSEEHWTKFCEGIQGSPYFEE